MRPRKLVPLLIALAVLAALGIALYLRVKAPPEAARLLPESDAILYIHLKPLRAATHFDTSPIPTSPELTRFTAATGIVPERDIDALALSLHRVPTPFPRPPHTPVAEVFTSEVFVGRFDNDRLARFLATSASARETYAGRTIYTVTLGPNPGETLRVTQLAYDTIGASNMPTAEQVHSMIDRARASALASPGSSLLATRYHDVPQLPLPAVAWGIGHIGLPFSQNGYVTVLGMQFPIPEDTDLIASVRYSGSAHLRVEEIAPDEAAAQSTTDTVTTLLNVLRTLGDAQLQANPAATDPIAAATRQLLSKANVEQHGKRVVLDVSASPDELKSLSTALPH